MPGCSRARESERSIEMIGHSKICSCDARTPSGVLTQDNLRNDKRGCESSLMVAKRKGDVDGGEQHPPFIMVILQSKGRERQGQKGEASTLIERTIQSSGQHSSRVLVAGTNGNAEHAEHAE
jgi:hypothetical protein